MNVHQLIARTKFTTPESQTIAAVQERIAELRGIQARTALDRWENGGPRSWLHQESDKAAEAFKAAPSQKLADAFHAAVIRCRTAEFTAPTIADICEETIATESAKLAGVMAGFFDRAEADLDRDHKATRAALDKAGSLPLAGDTTSDLDNRAAKLKAELSHHRAQALENPFMFIEQHGLDLPE